MKSNQSVPQASPYGGLEGAFDFGFYFFSSIIIPPVKGLFAKLNKATCLPATAKYPNGDGWQKLSYGGSFFFF